MKTLVLALAASLGLGLAPLQADAARSDHGQYRAERRHADFRVDFARHDGRHHQRDRHRAGGRHSDFRRHDGRHHQRDRHRARHRHAAPKRWRAQHRYERKVRRYWADGYLSRWERRDLRHHRRHLGGLGHDRHYRW